MLARTLYHFLQLRRNQWKSREELEKLQLKKLKAIVNHAYHNVPFYHDLYKKNKVRPEDIKTLKDIEKLPIISKANVRDNHQAIIAQGTDLKKCRISKTSGSTGIPLKIVENQSSVDYSRACVNFAFFEQGVRLGDVLADFTHLDDKKWEYKRKFIDKYYLSIFNSYEENLELLRKIKPSVLYAGPFTSCLHCKVAEALGITDIHPRTTIMQGGTLVPEIRKFVEKVFQTTVMETYGAREFMRLAFECDAHNGMHAISDAAIMEFLKNNEPLHSEEEGEIIVTGLYNYAMPLIRYNIGDLGILSQEKCSCGRTYPLIENVTGRQDDFFTLPSGKISSWYRLYRGLISVPGIREFQIIQEKKDALTVQVVEDQKFNEKSVQQIKETIQRGCQEEKMNINIKSVKKIPRGKHNKLRTFISKIKDGQVKTLIKGVT